VCDVKEEFAMQGYGIRLYSEKEAAEMLNISVKTLQAWRFKGNGPRYYKLGRCVRYKIEDLEDFLNNNAQNSTSGYGSGEANI